MSATLDGTLADPKDHIIADLQRQLAASNAERDEALQRETATAEVLQVINASPGDLGPVFDAMLERAVRLCETDFAPLWTYDGTSLCPVAKHRVPEPLWEYVQEHTPPAFARLVSGDRLIHVADVQGAIDQTDFSRNVRRLGLDTVRSLLIVPLRKDTTLLGLIVAYRREVRPFSDKQIALLQNFAAQAVIAMENARLLTDTREALEQQTATAEVLQVINSSPGDLAPVFDAILQKARILCGTAHASLIVYDGECFQAVATHGMPPAYDAEVRRPWRPHHDGPMGRLLRGEPLVHIPDMWATSGNPPVRPESDRPGRRRAIAAGTRTLLNVPLRKDGILLGCISAHRREVRPFSEKEIAVLQNFAAQAVIAMENARLLGELRARTEEIAAWNRELEDRVAAQLGELERAGRLKRFLAPQLAELIVASGEENILDTHRRDIVVVFCDLRGFTAFAETAEPEEVLELLREYHGALGPIVGASEGTLDHFSGDGIMVFFNDPVPVPDASERAVQMAIAMRAAMALLQAQWRRQGRAIGFGVGIARGYATLGQIGFADRIDYTAIGTVCNLAARLCAEAKDGQILISRRVAAAVKEMVRLEEVGDLALKGLMQAVAVYNVVSEPQPSGSAESRMAGSA